MNTLLVEIGSEEIPAGYIVPALNAFRDNMLAALDKKRIEHGEAEVFGTPRRLALVIEKVGDKQKAQTSTITGPPAKVGFDENGEATLAAKKFADKAGIDISSIQVQETPKGKYLTAVVEEKCETSASILEKLLPAEILSIPFPKSMRWGDLTISFARPIISLTGLLGEQLLNFTVGNIKSSSFIYGHQFMAPGEYKISSADKYIQVAESAGVIPDIEKRKNELITAVETCAKDQGAQILEDEELVDIVTNLVESPFPVVGSFDDEFLKVPDEILITAMREHQKYFALTDSADTSGRLIPKFIAVNNTLAKNMKVVASGHEKVIRARLADAAFFYETDSRASLDKWAEKLKAVTFQEKLGTVYDKSLRTAKLCRHLFQYILEQPGFENEENLQENLERAAKICKADLVSQVVIEFTKLQGVMGRVYALEAGESPVVAHAIEQHYRPVHSGGKLPEGHCASLLSIADKLDTLCGCFSVNLIPTGGADPYALRRQSIGIILIMLEQNYNFSLTEMIEKGLEPFMSFLKDTAKKDETAGKIKTFLQNRMVNILTDKGFSKEAVNSAVSASFDNIPDVQKRVKALHTLRKEADFESLSITFKRVENIIGKADIKASLAVNESLFENPAEKALYAAVKEVKIKAEELIQKGDYHQAMLNIASLRSQVDTFFDDVMVMAEDQKLRQNRLALLSSVSGLFGNIADFSKL